MVYRSLSFLRKLYRPSFVSTGVEYYSYYERSMFLFLLRYFLVAWPTLLAMFSEPIPIPVIVGILTVIAYAVGTFEAGEFRCRFFDGNVEISTRTFLWENKQTWVCSLDEIKIKPRSYWRCESLYSGKRKLELRWDLDKGPLSSMDALESYLSTRENNEIEFGPATKSN